MVCATLLLHVPACPCCWWTPAKEKDAAPACPYCGGGTSKPMPSDSDNPNSPRNLPPVNCPCLTCSPGFVPLCAPSMAPITDLVAAEFVIADPALAPDDVMRSRLDRPPRTSV